MGDFKSPVHFEATRLIPRKSGQVVGQILPQISLIPQIFIDFQEFAKTLYFQCVQLYVGSPL